MTARVIAAGINRRPPGARALPNDRYRAPECILTWARMCCVAQLKPPNRDEWPRFRSMLDCATVFGGWEELSGKSRFKTNHREKGIMMCSAHALIEKTHDSRMFERLLGPIIKRLSSQILLLALAVVLILAFANPQKNTAAIILIIFVAAILLWIVDKFIDHRFRQNTIRSEEVRWDDSLSQADRIFKGLVALDMSKVANDGTTRETDEILDFRIGQNPNAARNLVKLFDDARDVAIGSPGDREIKEPVREFLACYFATSGASNVQSLLLEPSVRKQLFASARADTNVYVRAQLIRALASTIQKSDNNACTEFVKEFIEDKNVLVSGYAYVFSKECTGVGLMDLQRAWEERYQDTEK